MARQEEEVWERLWEPCNAHRHDCRKSTFHSYEAEAKAPLTIDMNSTSGIEFLLRYFSVYRRNQELNDLCDKQPPFHRVNTFNKINSNKLNSNCPAFLSEA